MLTISKPLSASQAQAYHHKEFANAKVNYYSEGETIRGEWHGKLADQWGLRGEVEEKQFSRLANGQDPITGEQLVRHRPALEYVSARGIKIRTMKHRAGWDATFSAPKSVSLTALVGGDDKVRQAHRESVRVALGVLENYVQARLGANYPAETTGKWLAAIFQHDSARPVDDYAAPQLHTHVVFFNLTETEKGETRSLQPLELYRSQQYGTAIYRSELALRLRELGYEIEHGKSFQPEIKGYTREYLEASSPRRQQIKEHLEQYGFSGRAADQIAWQRTRNAKLPSIRREEMQQKHRDMAVQFGNQPDRIVREAHERSLEEQKAARKQQIIESALNHACEKNLERQAVVDERNLMRDSLRRSMGQASFAEVRERFEKRVESGSLIELDSKSPGRAFTTDEMIAYERDTSVRMRAGKNQHEMLVVRETRREMEEKYAHLTSSQRAALERILSTHDTITGLQGVAGAGRTTSLAAIREAAEHEGYEVKGLAPTSRTARKLAESGIESGTLRRYLNAGEQPDRGQKKRLYVLDESSLAAAKQINEFLHRLRDEDRVLIVGDTRHNETVEAGRPYQQLQEAGMQTTLLDEIVRQKDPTLREAAEQIARGDILPAVENLDRQGRVHEIVDPTERLTEIAREYVREPKATLAISPDNESRRKLNALIHREMRQRGEVSNEEHKLRVLDLRQEMTDANRLWAAQYELGDVVRYSRGSKVLGIDPGEYARVESLDTKGNRITIERENGEYQTYDPRRLSGVAVYQEVECSFSEGDRVQFTAPSKDLPVANGELGTIEKINDAGDVQICMDSGRQVAFNVREHIHLDYGYAVTSHGSQGQTAERVLIHVDSDIGEQLVNSRFAYISIPQHDVQIYTNDRSKLTRDLSRELSRGTATESQEQQPAAPKVKTTSARHKVHEQEQDHAHGIGFGMAH